MATHDARFVREASSRQHPEGAPCPAPSAIVMRVVLLVVSGAVAGLFYPTLFGWVFGLAVERWLLVAATVVGSLLGLALALVLGTGRRPVR